MSMIQNFELRGRITARAILAGSEGLDCLELQRALGFGARTTIGWMLAEKQLELVEPGRVRLAMISIVPMRGGPKKATLA